MTSYPTNITDIQWQMIVPYIEIAPAQRDYQCNLPRGQDRMPVAYAPKRLRSMEPGLLLLLQVEEQRVTLRKNVRVDGKKIADKNWVLTAYDLSAGDGSSAITATNEGKAAPATDKIGGKDTNISENKEKNVAESKNDAGNENNKNVADAGKYSKIKDYIDNRGALFYTRTYRTDRKVTHHCLLDGRSVVVDINKKEYEWALKHGGKTISDAEQKDYNDHDDYHSLLLWFTHQFPNGNIDKIIERYENDNSPLGMFEKERTLPKIKRFKELSDSYRDILRRITSDGEAYESKETAESPEGTETPEEGDVVRDGEDLKDYLNRTGTDLNKSERVRSWVRQTLGDDKYNEIEEAFAKAEPISEDNAAALADVVTSAIGKEHFGDDDFINMCSEILGAFGDGRSATSSILPYLDRVVEIINSESGAFKSKIDEDVKSANGDVGGEINALEHWADTADGDRVAAYVLGKAEAYPKDSSVSRVYWNIANNGKLSDRLRALAKEKYDETEAGGGGNTKQNRSDSAELTEEERKLRDAIVGLLRKAGIEVVTESEEGRRVLDEANGTEKAMRVNGREYAVIAHQISTYPKKVERNHVFSDNFYYLCTDIDYKNGTFKIIAQLSIAGNEDLINELRKEYAEINLKSLRTPKSVADLVGTIRHRGGWVDRHIPIVEGESNRNGTGELDSVAIRQQADRGADNKRADKLGSDEGWRTKEEIDKELSSKRDRIVELLKNRGFENISTTHSTAHGNSYYIRVISNDYTRELAKIRISDHSVTSNRRVLDEYHVFPSTMPEQVVEDLFGSNSADKFFRTENGEAYGFTMGGRIYLDPKIATAETPIHEYTHLWAEALRQANPKAWERLKAELEKDTDLMSYVQRLYPELKGDELMDEVFAHFSGRRGAERLRAEQERMEGETQSIVGKAKVIAMFENLRNALKKFWNAARELFAGKGVKNESAEDFADMVLADLVGGFNPNKTIIFSDNPNVQKNIEKGLNALERLANGEEEVSDAMHREELTELGGTANIAFIWGKSGRMTEQGRYKGGEGFQKIIEKHGIEDAIKIVETIAKGEIGEPYGVEGGQRVDIDFKDHHTTVSLFRNGVSKSWVLTGYTIDSNTDAKGRGGDLSSATQNDPIRTRAELGAVLKSAAKIRQIFDISEKSEKKNEVKYQRADILNDYQERIIAGQELKDEVNASGHRASFNADYTINLVHGTSPETAARIKAEGLQKNSYLAPSKSEANTHVSAKRKDNTFLYTKVDARDISYNGATNEYYAEDGLVMDEDGVWVSPQRKAARQADSEVRFRGEEEPVFYSNAMRAVENIKQERATPEQWLKMIEKNGGLKAGEDKWLGLSEWLKGQDKKSLTKQEVLEYIAQNKI